VKKEKIKKINGISWLDIEEYIFWSFRYFHGSRTIAANSFVKYEIPKMVKHLSIKTISQMIAEIKDAVKNYDYKTTMDTYMVDDWSALREVLHKELDRRKYKKRCYECDGIGISLTQMTCCIKCNGEGRI